MEKVRVGVIGLGGIAEQIHLPGLKKSRHAEIYAVCDQSEQRLALMGDLYEIPLERRFRDYAEMIALPEVDAIDIATPNFLHYAPAMLAFQHHKPVSLEKPVAMNYQQAVEMEQAAEAAGVQTAVCFSYRYMAPVRFARWMISNGYIGDILNIYIRYLKSSAFIENRPLEWRFQKELAGSGVLGDLGVHMIDMTRFLAGEIRSVCAQTAIAIKSRRKVDSQEVAQVSTDDSCDALLSLQSGAMASISVTRCAIGNGDNIKVSIYGTEGMIRFDPLQQETVEVISGKIDFTTGSIHPVKVPASFFTEQMDAFARSVQGEIDQYLPNLRDGVGCQQIVDALIEASEGKRWVDIGEQHC